MRPRAPTGILSRVQTIRASLLATAIAALLCPREFPRPGAELVGRALADVGRSEHGASALREERTEVGVATLGDAPEAANVTTGVLFAGLTTRCLTFKDVSVCTPTYLFGVRRHRQAN